MVLAFARTGSPSSVSPSSLLLILTRAAGAALLAYQSPTYAGSHWGGLQPPSGVFWFGTDELGRDIYSRIVYGSRITLGIVALIIVLVGPIGLIVGCARRLCRRLARHAADAHDRHLPRLSAAHPGRSPSSRRSGPASRTPSSPSPSPHGRLTRASPAPRRWRCAKRISSMPRGCRGRGRGASSCTRSCSSACLR